MSRETIYQRWRGNAHRWVPWVKPVAFAQIRDLETGAPEVEGPFRTEPPPWSNLDVSWAPAGAKTAIIVDLEGAESIFTSLALGARGFRPVILLNGMSEPGELIDTSVLAAALREGARFPAAFPDTPEAPPAFVLDARRLSRRERAVAGVFDNGWMVFESDLPSGKRLRERGIERLLVVHAGALLLPDLEDVLSRYAQEGFPIQDVIPGGRDGVKESVLPRRGWLQRWLRRVDIVSALQRRARGSFGRRIPVSRSAGG